MESNRQSSSLERQVNDFYNDSRWFRGGITIFIGLTSIFLFLKIIETESSEFGSEYIFSLISLTLIFVVYFVIYRFFRFCFYALRYDLKELQQGYLWLLFIVLLALLLRSYKLDYALPYLYTHDEGFFQRQVEQMVRHPDYFSPKRLVWPSMAFQLAAISTTIQYIFSSFTLQEIIVYIDALYSSRWLMALLSTLQIICLMAIAVKLANRSTALVVGLLASGNFAMCHFAHQGRVDPAVSFFVTLNIYLALLYLENRTNRMLVLWGLSLGFAAGTKYHVGVLAICCAILIFLNNYPNIVQSVKHTMILALSSMFGFWIAIPFLPFRLDQFLDEILKIFVHYQGGHLGHEGSFRENAIFYWSYLVQDGGGYLILLGSLPGFFFMQKKYGWKIPVFLGSYIIIQGGILLWQTTRFDRNILPIIPLLYLGAGITLGKIGDFLCRQVPPYIVIQKSFFKIPLPSFEKKEELQEKTFLKHYKKIVMYVMLGTAFAVVVPDMKKTFIYYNRADGPDTRTVTRSWIQHHIPPNETIWMLGPLEEFPQLLPNHHVQYERKFFTQPNWETLLNSSGYVLLSSEHIRPFLKPQPYPKTHQIYQQLLTHLNKKNPHGPLKEIMQSHHIVSGPKISIYKL